MPRFHDWKKKKVYAIMAQDSSLFVIICKFSWLLGNHIEVVSLPIRLFGIQKGLSRKLPHVLVLRGQCSLLYTSIPFPSRRRGAWVFTGSFDFLVREFRAFILFFYRLQAIVRGNCLLCYLTDSCGDEEENDSWLCLWCLCESEGSKIWPYLERDSAIQLTY